MGRGVPIAGRPQPALLHQSPVGKTLLGGNLGQPWANTERRPHDVKLETPRSPFFEPLALPPHPAPGCCKAPCLGPDASASLPSEQPSARGPAGAGQGPTSTRHTGYQRNSTNSSLFGLGMPRAAHLPGPTTRLTELLHELSLAGPVSELGRIFFRRETPRLVVQLLGALSDGARRGNQAPQKT